MEPLQASRVGGLECNNVLAVRVPVLELFWAVGSELCYRVSYLSDLVAGSQVTVGDQVEGMGLRHDRWCFFLVSHRGSCGSRQWLAIWCE